MKNQKNRSMKVYSQNGRNYKATPTIILKGQWLEEMGFAIGDAQVSTKHPDFVVNNGKASAADILAVLHEVQRRVQEKHHVHLPLDVRMMGEDFPQE